MAKTRPALPVVGWREWVELADLCDTPIKAKIDTGAQTSSLHAHNLRVRRNGADTPIATFEIHPEQRSRRGTTKVEHPIVGYRAVRSSSGHRERRPVIRTSIVVGDTRFPIDITLTSRDAMGFRMLLGRSALRRRFVVDPAASFIQGAA